MVGVAGVAGAAPSAILFSLGPATPFVRLIPANHVTNYNKRLVISVDDTHSFLRHLTVLRLVFRVVVYSPEKKEAASPTLGCKYPNHFSSTQHCVLAPVRRVWNAHGTNIIPPPHDF